MIKKSLILVFVVLTAIIWSGNSFASQNFRKFNINDYPKDKISTHELLTQVRDFSINILKELETCKNRGELEKQDYYCTNIYEADRLRLSLLLAINANLPENISTPDNGVSRLIFKKGSFNDMIDRVNPRMVGISDVDSENPQAQEIKKTLVQNSDIEAVTNNRNFHFFIKTANLGLKSCALGTGSSTKDRFVTLNPQLKQNNDKELKDYPPIGCNDLIEVLRQFANEKSLRTIFKHTDDFAWLNFTDSEKANITSTKEERDHYNNLKNDGRNYINAQSECALRGVSALILCPSMRFLGGASQAGLETIKNKLLLDPQFVDTSLPSGQLLYRFWQEFQSISNMLFIICLIIVVIAYLTNFKIETYHFKKIIPRLAGLVILSNLSFLIMRFGVDISNLTGQGLYKTFLRLSGSRIDIMSVTIGILSGAKGILLTGLVATAGFYFGGIIALVPILLFTFFSILAVIFSLVFRDIAFILSVIIAPLALASLLLPNIDRIFKVWKQTVTTIFMMPVVVGFCFGAGILAYSLLFRSGGIMTILSFIPLALQVFIFPKLLMNSVKNLPLVGDKLSDFLNKGSTFASEKYQDSDFHKTALRNDRIKLAKQREKGIVNKRDPRTYFNPITKPIRDKSRQAIDRILPGYSSVVSAPSFDPEIFKQISDLGSGLSPVVAKHFLIQNEILEGKKTDLSTQDSNTINQVNSLLNSNDPNNILSALIAMADDGEGNAQTVLKGLDYYVNSGGERSYINQSLKIIEANFQKESMPSDAAHIKYISKRLAKVNPNQLSNYSSLGIDDQGELIDLTAEYMGKITNWRKFKGFKDNIVDDQAFKKFINSQEHQEQYKQFIINSIKQQAGQRQEAMDYLKNF